RPARAWRRVYLTFQGSLLAFHVRKMQSAAPGATGLCDFVLAAKRGVSGARRCQLPLTQEASIGRFVENLSQGGKENLSARLELSSQQSDCLHPCSSAKRVATKGDSFTLACLRPESTRSHSTADSIRITVTITIRVPVTTASRRSLKISRAFAPAPEASCAACERKPMRGLGSKILCQEAVKVTATSHASGPSVTAA